MVGNGPKKLSLLDRFLGRRPVEKVEATKDVSLVELKQFLVSFQQTALESLTKMRLALSRDDREKVVSESEKFYSLYREFTSKEAFFKKAGGRFYMLYRVFVLSIGPTYNAVNDYVNGRKIDSADVLLSLRDTIKVLSEQSAADLDVGALAAK